MTTKFALWLCLCLALTRPAESVELSLEENRAQRGNIGYVDMQKVFKLFPETARAKENFEEVVRQAEEQLNIRKAEILRLRAELAQLKYDRSETAKTPAPSPAPAPAAPVLPLPLPAPAAALPPATTAAAAVDVSTAQAPALSTAAVAASTAAAVSSSTAPLIAHLPGLTAAQTAPPAAAPPVEPKKGLLAYSETPHASAPAVRHAELDAKIESKSQELAQKEKSYKEHQNEVEKNLLDLEGRRSEILLGKIHRVVKEVAIKEGVSVVVDKGAILYGQDAVDLTERVLKALKGS